jgi:hypothetical protein
VHYTTPALALADLAAGANGGNLLIVPLPAGNYERYLGVRYTVATGPMTAGAISAFLVRDIQNWRPYAVGNASNA